MLSIIRKPSIQSIFPSLTGQGFLLISGVISANLLGAEDRGRMALLVVYVSVIALVSAMGAPQSLAYYLAKNKTHYQIIIKRILQLFAFQVMLAYGLYWVFVKFYLIANSPELVEISYILSVSIVGISVLQYALAFMQGIGAYRELNLARQLPAGSFCILLIIALVLIPKSYLNLEFILICWLAVQIFNAVAVIYLAKSALAEQKFDTNISVEDAPTKSQILDFGLRGFLSFYSPIETFKFDQLFVGHFVVVKFLGVYVVSQSFANLPKIISQGMNLIFFPQISSASNHLEKRRVIRESIVYTLIIAVVFSLLLVVVIPYVFPIFFGDEFLQSIIIGQVLVVGASIYSIRKAVVECIRGLGFPLYSTWLELLIICVYVILFLVFLRYFGAMGTAYALVLSNVLLLGFSSLLLFLVLNRDG